MAECLRERYVWIALGIGAGLLAASVIAVAIGGPGWPYFLGLGVVALLVAFAIGRGPRQATTSESDD